MGSPVDLAKSYMRSLPHWQSPFLSSQRFNTSSSGLRIYDDGPSSKVTREKLCWDIDVNLSMCTYVELGFNSIFLSDYDICLVSIYTIPL
jgi:hypothetical protein